MEPITAHVVGCTGCLCSDADQQRLSFIYLQAYKDPITRPHSKTHLLLLTGDVIICVRPVDPSEHIIKRVVATAGDEVVVYPNKDDPSIRTVKVSCACVAAANPAAHFLGFADSAVRGKMVLAPQDLYAAQGWQRLSKGIWEGWEVCP